MKKILLLSAAACIAFGVSAQTFAWMDSGCTAGDNNPYCDTNMQLNTNSAVFCAGAKSNDANAAPKSFKYSAIKGCTINGKSPIPCNNWPALRHQISAERNPTSACVFELASCFSKGGRNSAHDCRVLYTNCTHDIPAFQKQCL